MSEMIIRTPILARVEGEGSLYVRINKGAVRQVRLKIYEPPRFFEAFLRGRAYSDAPDLTARICGICPVAYEMSAVHAIETIFGLEVGGQLRALRRLLYCGEWIESHALHVYLLHAPDFLGYQDAIGMAKDYPDLVKKGLALKKAGNEIMRIVGGREIHPINVRVGGFYRVPTRPELAALVESLEEAREIALETVRWTATLPIPDFKQDYEFVALRHPTEYPLNEGRLVSNRGLDIPISDFEDHFEEEHVAHSNALHSFHKGYGAYMVGPIARYNLNFDRLSPLAQQAARETGLGEWCDNPFQSIIVRSVETLYACDEALRIIREYEMPPEPALPLNVRAGTGYGCTEAPRGILYHRYSLDENGMILDAKIVPPTAQNQKMIEQDLTQLVTANLDLAKPDLAWRCEQAVRNYDPCISCATHFLKLEIEEEGRP
ncbi:MAG: Ni/Fe hydrogenase subunit alpha [Chloroflexi bacterium]|nr:Ni/Fe hydrogenase subunit alpha [Chloroflexota bacterium]OJW01866.1 MAG: Ni/Fe hydrogenase subunit alpha [Chloroflexi bacterium 54-19]